MEIEKLLKHRGKEDDSIIVNEVIVRTDSFTGLIEQAITANLQTKTLFLPKVQFVDMDTNTIIEQVKKHVPIGEDYHYTESNPYIRILYEAKARKSCN